MKIAVNYKKRVFFCSQSERGRWQAGRARVRGMMQPVFITQSKRDMWRNFFKKNWVTVHLNGSHDDQFCPPFFQPTEY